MLFLLFFTCKYLLGFTYNNGIEQNCLEVVKKCLVVERVGGLEDDRRQEEVEK